MKLVAETYSYRIASILNTSFGRVGLFFAIVMVVFAVFLRGVGGAGASQVVCVASCGGSNGVTYGGIYGGNGHTFTFNSAKEGAEDL